MANACLHAALWAHELNIARVERRFPLDNATLDILAGVRLRMALDEIQAFHEQAILTRDHTQDPPAFPAISSRDDKNVVVLPQRSSKAAHYRTSGASEIIFMKRR
jgi:hypothetical protein